MHYMKRIVLLLVTMALLTSSCSKLLDKDPDFVSPENYSWKNMVKNEI